MRHRLDGATGPRSRQCFNGDSCGEQRLFLHRALNCNGSCCPNATDTGATTAPAASRPPWPRPAPAMRNSLRRLRRNLITVAACQRRFLGNVCSCVSGMTCTGTLPGNANDKPGNAGICCTQTPGYACSGNAEQQVSDGCGGTSQLRRVRQR